MKVEESQLAELSDKKYFISIYNWINKVLFKEMMNLDNNTISWVKSLINLSFN